MSVFPKNGRRDRPHTNDRLFIRKGKALALYAVQLFQKVIPGDDGSIRETLEDGR